jgi:hypothetical protein
MLIKPIFQGFLADFTRFMTHQARFDFFIGQINKNGVSGGQSSNHSIQSTLVIFSYEESRYQSKEKNGFSRTFPYLGDFVSKNHGKNCFCMVHGKKNADAFTAREPLDGRLHRKLGDERIRPRSKVGRKL